MTLFLFLFLYCFFYASAGMVEYVYVYVCMYICTYFMSVASRGIVNDCNIVINYMLLLFLSVISLNKQSCL